MKKSKIDIWTYAHWKGFTEPELIGILSAHQGKGRKVFSFEYDKKWLESYDFLLLDPDIQFFSGPQYSSEKLNFGVFMDSMPDTWGRTLMKRKAALDAKMRNEPVRKLYEIDFLLGVHDETRMGGLRFKLGPDGPFLDDSKSNKVPPISSVRELQEASRNIELKDDNKLREWLNILVAPGSSLGGARPKANVKDEKGDLWIAKFPSKNDTIDQASWEYLAYQLAVRSGINMSESNLMKVTGSSHTFFTKRFDRLGKNRIHFSSAMTMTGNMEEGLKDHPASYLEVAEFLQTYGVNVKDNLEQLWRRIVFNIAISNTDDHLRNHGFILTNEGWILSPAYDINPSVDKNSLSLNIDMNDNSLDFELARSVGEYFYLNGKEMDEIIHRITTVVQHWNKEAGRIGISNREKDIMAPAFEKVF